MTGKIREEGERVMLAYDHESVGVVYRSGPEVCEIKLDNGTHRYIPNWQLKTYVVGPKESK